MIRDELLTIIAEALPETEEMEEFCGSGDFLLMLDKCIDAIKASFLSILED